MKSMWIRCVFVLSLVAGYLAGGQRLAAQEAPKPALPKAEDILDREVEALGGKAAVQKVKTVVVSGTLAAQDMKGRFTRYQTANRTYQETSIDGLFTLEAGVRDGVAWENHSITGPRVLKGKELTRALQDTDLEGSANWRKHYPQVRTVAEELVAGKPAYKVELTTRDGEVVINHYDKQTGLQVRHEATTVSAEGKQTMVIFFNEYRQVDGLRYPHTMKILVGPAEVLMTVDRIEYNVDIPAARFTLPPEVARLADKQAK